MEGQVEGNLLRQDTYHLMIVNIWKVWKQILVAAPPPVSAGTGAAAAASEREFPGDMGRQTPSRVPLTVPYQPKSPIEHMVSRTTGL